MTEHGMECSVYWLGLRDLGFRCVRLGFRGFKQETTIGDSVQVTDYKFGVFRLGLSDKGGGRLLRT